MLKFIFRDSAIKGNLMKRAVVIISVIVLFLYFVVEIDDNRSIKYTSSSFFKVTDDKKIKFENLTFNYSPEDIADKAYSLIDKIKLALFPSSAISIVKGGRIDDELNIDEWVSGIVGVRGMLNWKEFNPEDHDNRIKIVQLDMAREDGRNAKIQWLVNTETKYYKMNYIEIDGKEKSVLYGVMELELWPVVDLFKMFQ